jgi:NADPH:quinone reductase-like Zn-dependent oxidoreductase/acyl carrier protein
MHAEKEYDPQTPYLTYKIFNVEAPIARQDITAGGYDLVIAANVLHATKNIRQTLRNAKAALRNNGLILLNELSSNTLFLHLTFGLLEGWWLYQDPELRIPGCPGLSSKTWRAVLEREGFRSVFFPAQEAHDWGQQIIAAESDGVARQKQQLKPSAPPVKKKSKTKPGRSYTGSRTPQPSTAQDRQTKTMQREAGVDVTDQMIEDHVRTIVRECIADALKMEEERIQDDRSFSEYGVDSIIAVSLVNLINKQCNITLQTTVLFDYNNVDELVRHIIQEHQSILVSSLQENVPVPGQTGMESRGDAIGAGGEKLDHTYHSIKRTGKRNRFQIQDRESHQDFIIKEDQPIYHRVVIERPGGIDDLKVTESVVPGLEANEVCIAVRAFSLNFGDLLCVKGLYPVMPPYPFTPGFEASGIVVNVGNAVTSVHKGDAVVAIMGETLGAHASLITCSQEQVFQKPGSLSFEEACALPVVALTMIDAFGKVRLKQGERILIQTATGGIGLIALQLAQHYGAEVYATAGSQHKLDYLKKLGVPYRINYQETNFEKEIQRLTRGRGVDVVINTLAGDAIQKGMNCLSPGGRYIEIAMTALKSAKTIDLSVLNNNQTFYSIDMGKLGLKNPETVKLYREEMGRLVEQGIIHPTICQVFPLNQVKEAYQFLENRKNIGKIVVSIPGAYQFRETTLVSSTSGIEHEFMTPASKPQDTIAIIGMSGRFAKSKTVKELWQHLAKGTDLIEEVSRWDLSRYYPDSSGEEKSLWQFFRKYRSI